MTGILAAIIISAIWCFGYRCRGGPLSLGNDFVQRIVYWCIPVGLTVLAWGLVHGLLWWAIPVAVMSGFMAYIGLLFGHEAIQSGTTMSYIDGAGLGAFNMLLIAFPMLVYGFVTHTLTLFMLTWFLSGAWQGIAYFIGYSLPVNFISIKIGNDTFLNGPGDIGEFLTPLLPAIIFGLFGF